MNKLAGKTILCTMSGGLTSAFMCAMLKQRFSKTHNLMFVFYNTGVEREETLIFVDKVDKYFGLNLIWLESYTSPAHGTGITPKVVNFATAARNGEPFESGIIKYGLPSSHSPWCSFILKARLSRRYMNLQRIRGYYTAIGIRIDEIDRMSAERHKLRLIYPLITEFKTTKQMVWDFWSSMPFTLNLSSYEGNCSMCFKKSTRKLMTIAKESPDVLAWWQYMEHKYSGHSGVYTMYRDVHSINDIIAASKQPFKMAVCDVLNHANNPQLFDYELDQPNGCEESCTGF